MASIAKHTNRVVVTMAALCLVGVLFAFIMERRTDDAYERRLVKVVYEKSRGNGGYEPTCPEIRAWIKTIKATSNYDFIRRPVIREGVIIGWMEVEVRLWYLGQIWVESTFNPSAKGDGKKAKSGKISSYTRGLMGVSEDSAKDSAGRQHLKVAGQYPRSLYNPFFNIRCGVECFEHLLGKYGGVLVASRCYNSGERGACEKMWKGSTFDSSYMDKIVKRVGELEAAL